VGLILRSDSESGHCQNQGTHTNVLLPVPLSRQVTIGVWMLRPVRIR